MPTRAQLERNVRLYPWFTAWVFTPFFVPVIVLFWEDNGLDLFDVFLLQGLFALAMAVLEVPTGMLADRVGKRRSLLWGCGVCFVALVIYGLGHSFAVFLVAEICLAAAVALFSGADTALLYDSLKALGRENEYTEREARARALQMLSFAGTTALGGLLGEWSLRATVWATLIGPVSGVLIALRFTEVQHRTKAESLRAAWGAYIALLAATLRFVRKHALTRNLILLLAAFSGTSGWLLWMYQPYMEFVGWPVWAFGLGFAGANLFAAAVGDRAARIESRVGKHRLIVLLIVLQVIPPLAMASTTAAWGVALVLGHQAVRGIARPVITARILAQTWADKRSTIISLVSLSTRLFFAITAPLIGVAAERLTVPNALSVQAVMSAVLFAGLWEVYRRTPTKFSRIKDSVRARQ